MKFTGEVEQDQWGTPDNVTNFISFAIQAKNSLGVTISFGDLSTETGNSPRFNYLKQRHGTHYNGSQADMRYFKNSGTFVSDYAHR